MKLKKGSAEAKRYMASIRAKKKGAKKISGVKKTATKKAPTKKTASTHKDTKSHNVRISVVSGLKNDVLKKLDDNFIKIEKYITMKNTYSKMAKIKNISLDDRKHYKYMSNIANKHLLSFKKENILLKKLI